MKFRYVGEYPEGAESLRCYDVIFTPGAEVEVPDRCLAKAKGNRFFEEVEELTPKPEEPRNRLLTEPGEHISKDDLIARAETLGIKIDKRWSVAKIADAIDDANG